MRTGEESQAYIADVSDVSILENHSSSPRDSTVRTETGGTRSISWIRLSVRLSCEVQVV